MGFPEVPDLLKITRGSVYVPLPTTTVSPATTTLAAFAIVKNGRLAVPGLLLLAEG
jgi:hypothetical protein